MRSYQAARTYFSILEVFAWSIIVLGAIVAFAALVALAELSRNFGGPSVAGLAGLLPGMSIIFAGIMGLVVAQIGRAGVDSAEYAQQNLKVARETLDVSKQALKQGASADPSYAARQAAKADLTGAAAQAAGASFANPPTGQTSASSAAPYQYQGRDIGYDGGRYHVEHQSFETLALAQAYIDRMDEPAPANPAAETRS